jgi:hypothetical protein
LSKVCQLDSCFYVFLHDEGLNWKTFDKDNDYFKILIELRTNLRITYKEKDKDLVDGLL